MRRPLIYSCAAVEKEVADIEKTLLKIDEVASNQEGVAVEEALVLRGCVWLRLCDTYLTSAVAHSQISWTFIEMH